MSLDLTTAVNAVADRIYDRLGRQDRVLVAVAGAPAAGKTTLAGEIARRLNAQRLRCEVVGQDGFRLDGAILDARGLGGRRGAAESYDALGFLRAVERLRAGEEVIAPVFDRARDLSLAGALVVPAEARVVVCDGDHLLYAQPPWDLLAPHWDLAVRIEVPLPDLRSRLIQRWLNLGLSRAAATRRAEATDLPNARRVAEHALPADLVLGPDGR